MTANPTDARPLVLTPLPEGSRALLAAIHELLDVPPARLAGNVTAVLGALRPLLADDSATETDAVLLAGVLGRQQ